jgi:hypothetical protein
VNDSKHIVMIAAGEIRIGDELYNAHAYHPRAAWVDVVKVEPSRHTPGHVDIQTSVWLTIRHAKDEIAVRRPIVARTAIYVDEAIGLDRTEVWRLAEALAQAAGGSASVVEYDATRAILETPRGTETESLHDLCQRDDRIVRYEQC